ncbi:hypothetical protein AALP_AAs66836U000100, partial [Arabis alpina]
NASVSTSKICGSVCSFLIACYKDEGVRSSKEGASLLRADHMKTWVLTEEGKKYAAQGSPEVQLFLAVPEEGSISVLEPKKKLGESIVSFAWKYAKENKWVDMEKSNSQGG